MKLRLDVLTAADCERVRGWRNQDIAGLRTPFLLTEEMQADFYRRVVCDRGAPHRYFAVRDEDLDVPDELERLVAMVGLTNLAYENGTAEIALIVDPARQGHGIGAAAVDLVLDEAFLRMRLETVYGECYVGAALGFWQKIAESYKAYTTTLPRRKFWNGVLHDAFYFSIALQDWMRKERTP